MMQRAVLMGLVLAGLCLGQAQAGKPLATQAPLAQNPAPVPATLNCASQVVLENLVALIVKSNQLDPSLNFRVSQVKTDPSQRANKQASEQGISCIVHLQIVHSNSEELVDELDIAYRIISQENDTFGLEFSPIRKGSQ